MRILKDGKALSPIIATVVLATITITIAVAVGCWTSGVLVPHTKVEKLEVGYALCESGDSPIGWGPSGTDNSSWKITINFRNTGTSEAVIRGSFINNIPIADFGTFNGTEFRGDHIRAFDESISGVQLDFEKVGTGTTEKKVILPGCFGNIIIEIKQKPSASEYSFSSGTAVEVSLKSSTGNNYMKMVPLS